MPLATGERAPTLEELAAGGRDFREGSGCQHAPQATAYLDRYEPVENPGVRGQYRLQALPHFRNRAGVVLVPIVLVPVLLLEREQIVQSVNRVPPPQIVERCSDAQHLEHAGERRVVGDVRRLGCMAQGTSGPHAGRSISWSVVATREAALLSLRWRKASRALESGLRVGYLRSEMHGHPLAQVARALDEVCACAEQAEADAREILIAVVDLLADRDEATLSQRLREEAMSSSLLSLARLLRRPVTTSMRPPALGAERVPDYGTGRTLTLGERKALARRPTRKAMDKLFADPHPVVIRTLLANPKVVEDDVIRLAARRPNSPEVLAEIARSPRWAHRVRVRMAIVLNPDSPPEFAIPLLALLVRPELRLVAAAAYLAPALRLAARDLLARRPPVRAATAKVRLQ